MLPYRVNGDAIKKNMRFLSLPGIKSVFQRQSHHHSHPPADYNETDYVLLHLDCKCKCKFDEN